MASGRVRIHQPPGARACGDGSGGEWIVGRDINGASPWWADVERVKRALPSDEARALFIEELATTMGLAESGKLPWDLVGQMSVAPDVLEIRLPDWWYSGGKMHTRLYFSEPHAVPGNLVALRLRFKRPGPIGLEQQDRHITEASDLLLEFDGRGYE